MARLSPAQQDVLFLVEAGGRIVEDETGAPWIEDPHGGRRRVRKPTLLSLQAKGYLSDEQMTMPKIAVSVDANVEYWSLYLSSIFLEEGYLKLPHKDKKTRVQQVATHVVHALRETARTARLYIPENRA